MTPPDELQRRAIEEVAQKLEKSPSYVQFATACDLRTIDDPQTLNEVRAVALSVRLMRYKLQVEKAKGEIQGKIEEAVHERDECDHYNVRWCIMEGHKEAYIDIKRILTKHTQEEQ